MADAAPKIMPEEVKPEDGVAPAASIPHVPMVARDFATREDLEKAITDTNLKYGTCLLEHWQFCLGGILVGLPLSIKYKSQLYWAIGGVSGTLLDYTNALAQCKHYRHEAEDLTRLRRKFPEEENP
mmetsp:Transcript_9786/g.19226  ORF Transcript_9786/g.19226 Transcript_9786/m.19226 type:complete len:126 (+) Transcript_9786:61-438(+)